LVFFSPEYDIVKLLKDFENLKAGLIGTVLIIYEDGLNVEVEFIDNMGETVGLKTILLDYIVPV
jgi:hypothetical protein